MTGTGEGRHVPVMLERCVELLSPALAEPGAVVVDATVGLGGHSAALLARCPNARLVGIDRDPQALDVAGRRLAGFGERVRLVHAVYDQLPAVLLDLGIPAVRAVLLDLGVSSLQLDQAARGFSYATDAPLDMRMDPTSGRTAADILNSSSARSSALTSIRNAWNVRLAGCPPARRAGAGIERRTSSTSRALVSNGCRSRSRSIAAAIRRAKRSSP